MRGRGNLKGASVHPVHGSGSIADDVPHERGGTNTERQYGPDDEERFHSLSLVPPPAAKSPEGILTGGLADFLGRRQEPDLGQLPSAALGRIFPLASGMWREQLLEEIENLAEALNEKVARYLSLRESPSIDEAARLADVTAVIWIQDALEDIAATAVGIEIASRRQRH